MTVNDVFIMFSTVVPICLTFNAVFIIRFLKFDLLITKICVKLCVIK